MKEFRISPKIILLALIFHSFFSYAQWQEFKIDTTLHFRSIHAINKKIVWAGGTKGSILKTMDGGTNWQILKVKEAENFDFRDIYVWNEHEVLAMSAGNAEDGKAKLFKTYDGGRTWKIVFESKEKGAFFDAIDFLNMSEGFLVGDAIDGKAYILKTSDKGNTWKRIDANILPKMKENEASFAASGSSLVAKEGSIYICTQSRLLKSEDKGNSWQVFDTPFIAGQSSGIFGLFFNSAKNGLAVGGEYKNIFEPLPNLAITMNGGETWQLIDAPKGLKESVYQYKKWWIITGPSGTDISDDAGKTWKNISMKPFHALSAYKNICWLIGAKGNLAKFVLSE